MSDKTDKKTATIRCSVSVKKQFIKLCELNGWKQNRGIEHLLKERKIN
jgi:hypothetical protein